MPSFRWFCFVCLASHGTENNLLGLWQLMDSAGAGAHEMGTERHFGEVCGLEGRGGAATQDGEQSPSEGVPAAESHTMLCCLPAPGSARTQQRRCGALHLVSQPQGAGTRCLVLGLLRTQDPCPPPQPAACEGQNSGFISAEGTG